jgi:hypothetical protein
MLPMWQYTGLLVVAKGLFTFDCHLSSYPAGELWGRDIQIVQLKNIVACRPNDK